MILRLGSHVGCHQIVWRLQTHRAIASRATHTRPFPDGTHDRSERTLAGASRGGKRHSTIRGCKATRSSNAVSGVRTKWKLLARFWLPDIRQTVRNEPDRCGVRLQPERQDAVI
jgi:hypothetical protein